VKVVIDSNIVISCLLATGRKFSEILFSSSHEFYSCNFLIIELFKHKEKIVKYSGADEKDVLKNLHNIIGNIHFINDNLVDIKNRQKAFDLCKEIDEKDIPFIALTLELDALLWTGDKQLKQGLQQKGFDKFFEI
jgi:predicted nucleic acid-binding protein